MTFLTNKLRHISASFARAASRFCSNVSLKISHRTSGCATESTSTSRRSARTQRAPVLPAQLKVLLIHSKNTRYASSERGFALLLALIISTVVLSIGLTLLAVALKQLNLSATSRESEVAFQMANLGMECGRYWREQYAVQLYNTGSADGDFGGVTCVSTAPSTIDFTAMQQSTPGNPGPDAQQNVLHFELDIPVGGEDRCIKVDIHTIDAFNGAITNHTVGRVVTSCDENERCTVIVSQGYNRSCGQVESSIFSVQRELTAEF